MRGTTRDQDRLAEIEATGAEAVLGDPDRVATLVDALDHVTIVCILLASATGPDERLRALHGSRLEMLVTKLTDTTVRGVVYEARGTIEQDVLAAGVRQIRAFRERTHARAVLLDAEPEHWQAWLPSAVSAVERAAGMRA